MFTKGMIMVVAGIGGIVLTLIIGFVSLSSAARKEKKAQAQWEASQTVYETASGTAVLSRTLPLAATDAGGTTVLPQTEQTGTGTTVLDPTGTTILDQTGTTVLKQ